MELLCGVAYLLRYLININEWRNLIGSPGVYLSNRTLTTPPPAAPALVLCGAADEANAKVGTDRGF